MVYFDVDLHLCSRLHYFVGWNRPGIKMPDLSVNSGVQILEGADGPEFS